MSQATSIMSRTVLLLHRLPDGSTHFDWLIERTPGEERVLTIRLADRPDRQVTGSLVGRRLTDHRRVYLALEGEISGGRGFVERIAEGELEAMPSSDPTAWVFRGGLGSASGMFHIQKRDSSDEVVVRFTLGTTGPGSPVR
jgi:hypothetical protein